LAGKFTDRELRLRALKLVDAYDQPGIFKRPIADGDRLLDILNVYQHAKYPKEKVYCSVCNGHHHGKGFTALVMTQSKKIVRMLLGSKCGAEAFGQDWKTAERRQKADHNRQWELKRLDRLEIIHNELKAALTEWRRLLPAVVGRRSAFALKLGDLETQLREAFVHQYGRMFVNRTVTLKNGEKSFDTQLLEEIPGAAVLDNINATALVDRLLASLDAMAACIGRTDTIPTSTLLKRRREFENAFEFLDPVHKYYLGAQDFFTAETFEKIAHWTQRYKVTERPYAWSGEGLGYKDGYDKFNLPKPFPDLDEAPLDLINEYRRAD
jgi:hypothetical protein